MTAGPSLKLQRASLAPYTLLCSIRDVLGVVSREVGDRTLKIQDLGPPIPNRTGSLSLHTALREPLRRWLGYGLYARSERRR